MDLAAHTVGAFMRAAALVTPTGKQNSFAAHNPPDGILVQIQDRNIPISYANAFAKPVDLCILCKSPATTVQHITYRRAGGNETPDDLRSLCRLCHDAVTMIEYGAGMGLDRINPEEKKWREQIIEKRSEIIRFRSIETRRRHLSNQEV